MKLINLILLLLPLTGFSQVDTVIEKFHIVGDKIYTKVLPKTTLYKLPEVHQKIWNKGDTLRSSAGYKFIVPETIVLDTTPDYIRLNSLNYYGGSRWYDNWTTELVKGEVETPVNVMDSGMKVEVVETRDTIYKCPLNMNSYTVQYFNAKGEIENHIRPNNCTLDEIVTTRRYKLYIINEYGQKEYLSMEFQHQKK